ncbi:SusC/RagA family TonB-linked outer membrane protein [Spongiimicrobium sp. 3-5]|uniref:SusC/RagA family TonB-linked outer membrane protein n=1 Tax=Spongiimicrobium sp. 3-5 TaxID=3332596 RepID=UPI003980D31E
MKNKLLKRLVLLGLLLSGSLIYAQTITGIVSDEGGPLPGVNILVKGTTNGTQTDFDGLYTLENVGDQAIIVFSYIGFKTLEITVNGQTKIDVTLEEDAAQLDEVVIIGYGTTTVKDATGSIASVKAEDFNKGVITSPNELLQGRVSGVQITGASGEPGAGSNIRIRGTTSIRGGNNPLYVIDGIPLDGRDISEGTDVEGLGESTARNPLNFINANDIASIDILKDASATAIYGSRGANGVVIITTKKGKSGDIKLSYNGAVSVSTISNRVNQLSADEFREALVVENLGNASDLGGNEDAFDDILRTAFTQTHDVSFSGGSEKSTYRVSFGYQNQEGIVKNSGLERTTGSFNLTQNLFYSEALGQDRVRVDTKLIYSSLNDDAVPITDDAGFEGSLIGQALQWNPTRPLRNPDGSFNQPGNDVRNPLAFQEFYNDRTNTSRILANIGATIKLTSELDYKLSIGYERSESNRRLELSPQLILGTIFDDPFTDERRGQGFAEIRTLTASTSLFEHTLNYRKEFGENFRFEALAGYSFQEFLRRGNSLSAQDFVNVRLPIDFVNVIESVRDPEDINGDSFKDPTYELQSFFGRVNFSFYDKYLFTASLRADGSTRFGENNKYGYFPAAAFAWKLTEEDFIPEAFSNLKLRLGYGINGNQEFGSGFSRTTVTVGQTPSGTAQTRTGNPDLKWEQSSQINIGLDYGFFNGRLSGSVDWFNKNTTDLLFQTAPILPAPDARFFENLDAEIVNTGVDVSLSGVIVQTKDMDWEVSVNAGFIKNEVKNYDGAPIFAGQIDGQGLSAERAQIIANGEALFAFSLPIFEGFDSNGLSIFTDVDGDGVLETGPGGDDRIIAGGAIPDITIGINSSFRYKNFDTTVNLNGAYGGEVYNNTANGVFVKGNINNSRNISANIVGNGESVSNANSVSTRYLESGDFLRLANLTVGYTLQKPTPFIDSARFYVTGQNLFVITPYSGFDPEVNTNKTTDDDIPSLAIEYTPYPRATTFVFGLNVNF